MDLGLTGKVALVAAASRGLGRAVALGLGAEGAKLVLCARGAKDLELARDDIAKNTGAEIHSVVADVSNDAHIEMVASQALAVSRTNRPSRSRAPWGCDQQCASPGPVASAGGSTRRP